MREIFLVSGPGAVGTIGVSGALGTDDGRR